MLAALPCWRGTCREEGFNRLLIRSPNQPTGGSFDVCPEVEHIGMALAVKKFAGEPIYILSIDLPLERHVESLRSVNAAFNRFISEITDPLYILIDARALAPTFSDILIALELQRGMAVVDRSKASHVHCLLIGEHPMLKIGCKRAKEYLGIDIGWHTTLEAALAHVRAESSYRATLTDAGDTV
jgi:hypothetical protein